MCSTMTRFKCYMFMCLFSLSQGWVRSKTYSSLYLFCIHLRLSGVVIEDLVTVILIIVAFLENATIGYSLESLCVCVRVCVCVYLHDNSKRKSIGIHCSI